MPHDSSEQCRFGEITCRVRVFPLADFSTQLCSRSASITLTLPLRCVDRDLMLCGKNSAALELLLSCTIRSPQVMYRDATVMEAADR